MLVPVKRHTRFEPAAACIKHPVNRQRGRSIAAILSHPRTQRPALDNLQTGALELADLFVVHLQAMCPGVVVVIEHDRPCARRPAAKDLLTCALVEDADRAAWRKIDAQKLVLQIIGGRMRGIRRHGRILRDLAYANLAVAHGRHFHVGY